MKRYARWIWLAQKCGAGSTEVATLVERFGSVYEIYEADFDTYMKVGISERLAEDLCDKSLDEANGIINFCQTNAIGILTYDEARYPSALRSIPNPPAVLYYVGKLPDFNKDLFISVVGTRSMSEYGMRAAYKIAYEVAAAGATLVSGMALGIDGVAAVAAMAAGGKTVAVLGCGIDKVYPKEHATLKDTIKRKGAIITEFAPMTEPRGANFPIRNRIISGLSRGTVVVDADMDSGAMITAKNAILQGRDIYAVPSNIDSQNSSGTNSLIRDGAQAVLCGNDVIKNYAIAYKARLNVQRMHDAEACSNPDMDWLFRLSVSSKGKRGVMRLGQSSKTKEYAPSAKQKDEKNNVEQTIAPQKSPHYTADISKTEQSAYERAIGIPAIKQTDSGDRSREALAALSENQRRVFDEIPLDIAVTVDYLTRTGLKLGEVISALTVLEVKGLVESLPGALYIRK